MISKHYELIEELMKLVDVGECPSSPQLAAFFEKLNASRAMTDNDFPGEFRAYLEARQNLKLSTVFWFAITARYAFQGRAVDEIAIECHRLVLGKCSARSNWRYWRMSQLALAKIHQEFNTPKSNECIRQLVDAKIARDKRDFIFFMGVTFASPVILTGCCFFITTLAKGNSPIVTLIVFTIQTVNLSLLMVSLLNCFRAISRRPKSYRLLHEKIKLQKQLITTATSPVAPIEIHYLDSLICQEFLSDSGSRDKTSAFDSSTSPQYGARRIF